MTTKLAPLHAVGFTLIMLASILAGMPAGMVAAAAFCGGVLTVVAALLDGAR